jgi:hypothetical protein
MRHGAPSVNSGPVKQKSLKHTPFSIQGPNEHCVPKAWPTHENTTSVLVDVDVNVDEVVKVVKVVDVDVEVNVLDVVRVDVDVEVEVVSVDVAVDVDVEVVVIVVEVVGTQTSFAHVPSIPIALMHALPFESNWPLKHNCPKQTPFS